MKRNLFALVFCIVAMVFVEITYAKYRDSQKELARLREASKQLTPEILTLKVVTAALKDMGNSNIVFLVEGEKGDFLTEALVRPDSSSSSQIGVTISRRTNDVVLTRQRL